MAGAIDAVFTWVDDAWPGYGATLAAHSGDLRDRDPKRTRDNLELLRYALRALDANLPQVRRVYLLSMRPQVPAWLDPAHPDLRIVHHDAVIDARHLPTFNSFAIVSHLHRLPGIAERFLYIEDDMMIADPGALAALSDADGAPYTPLRKGRLPDGDRLDPARESPWNLALAATARALDARHGARVWPRTYHGPRLILRDAFAETMEDHYAPEIATTRAARFRSGACVAPEVLYPLDRMARGLAAPLPQARPPVEGYAALYDLLPLTAFQLARLRWRAPRTLTFNDGFGPCPNPRTERHVKRWLDDRFPEPSRFERAMRAR